MVLLVPLGYFVLDMLENAAVAGMLRAGPDGVTDAQAARANGFTVWKFRFVNLALGLVIVAGLWRGLQRWRDR